MATFLAANDALAAARNVIFAVAVTVTGAALIFGPWMWRLARQLGEERRERIRSEERAEVAAHLHDSVLQTLALIQRSEHKGRMVALARSQERELRAWLYGRRRPADPGVDDVVTVALDDVASRIERLHEIPVEVVTVGDCAIDDRTQAVIDATAEAVQNAAKHAGAPAISVYSEVDGEAVRVFIRDQGRGFDPARVPADRRGILDSIQGRIVRYGGTAEITSRPGQGTEVKLWMPRRQA
jgi:signal transduction histidine kinase